MPTQEFVELVTFLKEALAVPDPDKAAIYRAEIESVPQHIDWMASMIP